jgi:hypothetical protein
MLRRDRYRTLDASPRPAEPTSSSKRASQKASGSVAEAMWKASTVASRVGAIQDQIEPGVSGMFIEASDLAQFGAAMTTPLVSRSSAYPQWRR